MTMALTRTQITLTAVVVLRTKAHLEVGLIMFHYYWILARLSLYVAVINANVVTEIAYVQYKCKP